MRGVRPTFWRGKRVFLTGHTGFKGSWLAFWLSELGAHVRGFALPPNTDPGLFDAIGLAERVEHHLGDVRDLPSVQQALTDFEPEIVFHLAAQPLVRESYRSPVDTFATNVMGTVHVIEAARHCESVRVVVNITTDKVYDNREWAWGYRECDPLGGHDPYSASKACSELVTSAYARSFLTARGVALATARAGNVIGGGDWGLDRLVPDSIQAFAQNMPVVVRNPHAIRPWQHVVEPLRGYLQLAETCHDAPETFSRAFNFGPRPDDMISVAQLMSRLCHHWPGARWEDASDQQASAPHEATFLKLDTTLARSMLNWAPQIALEQALEWTAAWYRAFYENASREALQEIMRQQIQAANHPAR